MGRGNYENEKTGRYYSLRMPGISLDKLAERFSG
jgi:hypothetical protein